jgi:DNA-binding transcriptional LysR family regulator
MELRHLRYFVAVAEERHFGRAAERLSIAQPPLSMQIQALERELGSQLFRRNRRAVELTEAGRLLLQEAYRVLADVDRAIEVVRRAERGEKGTVQVGFTSSASFNPFVMQAIRRFRESFPDVGIMLVEDNTEPLAEMLKEGSLDAAFLRPPITPKRDIQIDTLLQEEMLIALPAGHRLANEPALPLSSLRDEIILIRPRPVGVGIQEKILTACETEDFGPTISRQAAPQMSSILNLVAGALGVSIVPASMGHLLPGSVVYKPIIGPFVPRAPLAIAYRTVSRSAAVTRFVESVRHEADLERSSLGQ